MAKKHGLSEEPYRRPMGYFEARASAQNLRRYFDLVKIFYRLTDNGEQEEILKKYPQFKGDHTLNDNRLIRIELNRLSVRVYWALLRVRAPLEYTVEHTETEYDTEKHKNIKTKRQVHVNIILDQFQPSFHKDINILEAYEILVNVMEQAVPVYESIQKSYWKNLINPLWVIAMILRIPISLLEHMGINTSSHETNKFIYWLMQSIVLIVLIFLCARLGISAANLTRI
jgi:hypothetical protein